MLTPKFNSTDISNHLQKALDKIEKRQIRTLQYLGELCIIEARTNYGYTVQTNALLSSTGYLIFKDGIAIHSDFEGGSPTGIKNGKDLAANAAKRFPKGIALVVVAGMNYAVHVEATGRNVLTSAESLAKNELPKMLNELKNKINKAIE